MLYYYAEILFTVDFLNTLLSQYFIKRPVFFYDLHTVSKLRFLSRGVAKEQT